MKWLKRLLTMLGWIGEDKREPEPEPPIDDDPPVVSEPEPEPRDEVEERKQPGKGSNVLLWKPHSESTRTCVILLPSRLRPSKIQWLSVNGAADIHPKSLGVQAVPDSTIWPNGDRVHIYLNKAGADYGGKVILSLKYAGKVNSVTIPNGAKRLEMSWR